MDHITTYGLWHSFATLYYIMGMSLEVLNVIMGHANFDTTRKYYIHITKERKTKWGNILIWKILKGSNKNSNRFI